MSTDTGSQNLAELAEHAEMVKDRIRHVAAEIKALLADDLPKFVERELKRGFVEHPEFASRLSDAAVVSLKAAVKDQADRGRDEVVAALEDESLWFPPHGTVEGRGSIADNPPLWSAVSGIVGTVVALREKFGYPASTEGIEYKAPTWFIGRRYLPTLSEKYWRLIAELRELETQVSTIRKDTTRGELSKRWDGLDG